MIATILETAMRRRVTGHNQEPKGVIRAIHMHESPQSSKLPEWEDLGIRNSE